MNVNKDERAASNDVTKEQLSDVYAAGTSDGLMITEDGVIRIREDGSVEERSTEANDQ